MINFIEKIGDYTLINRGEIIVYNDKEIIIELRDEEEPIYLIIRFKNQGGRISSIERDVNKDTLILNFINYELPNSLGGIFEPILVGNTNDKKDLYFSCAVFTLDATKGYRLFKYSFLTLNN